MIAPDGVVGMGHQALADEAGGVGETVGMLRQAEFSRSRGVSIE